MEHFRLRSRWVLPVGHLLVDCVLLVALIAQAERVFGREKSQVQGRAFIVAVQEDSTVSWDPEYMPPSPPFAMIQLGNLPAGLMSELVRPRAWVVRRNKRWDGEWFGAQEVAAFACWYLIGILVERRPRAGKVMMAFLSARLLFATLGAYDIGQRVEALCWLGFLVWLLCLGIVRVSRFAHNASSPPQL